MKNAVNRFLEKFEMSMELGLRYGIIILMFLGLLMAVGGNAASSYGAFKEIFDDVLWAVLVVGLLLVWRELRQFRRRLEGMHVSGADVFEEAMVGLKKSKAKRKPKRR